MSYLHRPGLTFAGLFQADVATGNNTFANYTPSAATAAAVDASWNAFGGGQFRLLECRVTSVVDGGETAADDPIRRAAVTDAVDRVTAKIVDLDTQYQGASELYGLQVRFVADGVVLVAGEFELAAFRDIASGAGVLQDAHARYVSVLGDLTWAPPGTSGFIDRLRATTAGEAVAIRLTTYRYAAPGKLIGRITGAIGPRIAGEPRRFIAGRHFDKPPAGLPNDFDGIVSPARDRLTVDLSNSLPVDRKPTGVPGNPQPGPPLLPTDVDVRLALLRSDAIAVNDSVQVGEQVIRLSEPLPFREAGWLSTTGGLVTVDVPPDAQPLIGNNPLALVTGDDPATVLIRETSGGWLVRADNETLRLEPGTPTTTRIMVSQYGVPRSGVQVLVAIPDPHVPRGGGPKINTPRDRLNPRLPDPTLADGWTTLTIEADPRGPGSPRPSLDGQLYEVMFGHLTQADVVYIHLYDLHRPPDQPTWWGDVQPILAPYAALYPLMTQRVFDLADLETVRARHEILRLALSLDISHPSHMPVTRDLSAGKRATILAWLALPDLPEGDPPPVAPPIQPLAAEAADELPGVSPALVGKIQAERGRAELIAEQGREQ